MCLTCTSLLELPTVICIFMLISGNVMTGVDKPRLLLPIFYVIIVLFVNCIGVQMLPADNTDTPLDANNVAPLF